MGDGWRAVTEGDSRSGCGYAHSGVVASDPDQVASALSDSDGWFELMDGEWESIQPHIVESSGWRFRLQAEAVKFQELVARGEEQSEFSETGGPVDFGGVRFA